MRCWRRSVHLRGGLAASVVVSVTIAERRLLRTSPVGMHPCRRMPSGSPSGANRLARCGVRSIGPLRGTPHTERLTTSRMSSNYVVVDGSNIATEGRSLPSLAPARRSRAGLPRRASRRPADRRRRRHLRPPHRRRPSAPSTRRPCSPASSSRRPPAPSAAATPSCSRSPTRPTPSILSNDSFQEFHGQYTWLFDEGRLIGGKPVPGVGWVFLLRTPVRGPASRRSVQGGPLRAPDVRRASSRTGAAATDARPGARPTTGARLRLAAQRRAAARRRPGRERTPASAGRTRPRAPHAGQAARAAQRPAALRRVRRRTIRSARGRGRGRELQLARRLRDASATCAATSRSSRWATRHRARARDVADRRRDAARSRSLHRRTATAASTSRSSRRPVREPRPKTDRCDSTTATRCSDRTPSRGQVHATSTATKTSTGDGRHCYNFTSRPITPRRRR